MSRNSIAGTVMSAGVLAGCATLPQLPSREILPIADVVAAFQCETKAAVYNLQLQHPDMDWRFLSKWAVGAGLTLIAEDKGELSADLNSVIPITRGTFNIGLNADLVGTAKRTVNLKMTFAITDLNKLDCNRPIVSGPHALTSNLGLYEWLDRSFVATDKRNAVGDLLSVGTTIQFTALAEGKLSPKVSLVRTDFGGFLSGTRTDDHTLDLSFAPIPAEPKPTEVIIVGRR